MSSTFRHICHGIDGETGAPRPTLVNSTRGGSVREEHDIDMATNNAARAARLVFMAADHTRYLQ
jgi:hypothetical protein